MKKTLKGIVTLMLVLLLSAALMPMSVSAAWSGNPADKFGAGTGTQADPYIIGSAEELALLAKNVNSGTGYEGSFFKLNADIDLGELPWEPIGNYVEKAAFMGNFDGGGHTVSGLNVDVITEYAGLFGYITGSTIENLNVKGSQVSCVKCSGAIVGCGAKSSNIINCTSEVETVKGYWVGGIAGRMEGLGASGELNQIKACFSSSNLKTIASNNVFVGGITGACGATVISYCGNSGSIELTDGATTLGCAGGIVGIQGAGSKTAHIRNCYNTGDINVLLTVEATYAGGIVGRAAHVQDYADFADVKNCFTTANVTVKDMKDAAVAGKSGSIIGHIRYLASVENCYTNKSSTDIPEVGADDLGAIEVGNITILTDAQMKGDGAVATMKLDAVWTANDGYPTVNADALLGGAVTPEVTTVTEEITTAEEPVVTTELPPEVIVTEPEQTTVLTTTVPPEAETTPAPDPGGADDGNGVNIFIILIIVVVVAAAAVIVIMIITDKKKGGK